MRFSPNDYVTVKLTEEGKRRHVAYVDSLNDTYRDKKLLIRARVEFDPSGIMRSQFWCVMQSVGGYCPNGTGDILFEWIEPETKMVRTAS